MINFIKNLLGLGAKETVQEILTPVAPYKIEPAEPVATYVEPVKPVFKPAVTEGNTNGGTGAVKKQKPRNRKPKAPAKPQAKPAQPAAPANKGKPANKPKAKTKK